MNESIREWFRYHTDFLYTLIYKNGLFYLDFWSLVHCWSAIVIFTAVLSLGIKRKWFWYLFIIVIYEIIEVLFIYFALHIFRPERFNDQIMDIIVGIATAAVLYNIMDRTVEKGRAENLPSQFFMVFSSCTFAFVWVGNYHYHYNLEILNTQGLNIWAFILWATGGYSVLLLDNMMKKFFRKIAKRIIATWFAYVIILLVLEFIGYHILEIRETSIKEKSTLIFGLIHGTLAMHLYYIFFPFIIIIFYELLLKLNYKARLNLVKLKNGQVECSSALS